MCSEESKSDMVESEQLSAILIQIGPHAKQLFSVGLKIKKRKRKQLSANSSLYLLDDAAFCA